MTNVMYDTIRDLTLHCGISEDTARAVLERMALEPDFSFLVNESLDGTPAERYECAVKEIDRMQADMDETESSLEKAMAALEDLSAMVGDIAGMEEPEARAAQAVKCESKIWEGLQRTARKGRR